MALQPYQQRVVEERAELADKVGRLSAFIATGMSALSPDDATLLVQQHEHMDAYLTILDARIQRFQGNHQGA